MNKIEQSTLKDMDEIFRLYHLATEYQKLKFPDNLWPEFERSMVEDEIKKGYQWKLVKENQIACVWAIAYSDPYIWEEKNIDPSIYFHRIGTNPSFRGQRLVGQMVEWGREKAMAEQKKYLRMDTCGQNDRLIAHYQSMGFEFLGIKRLKDTGNLPAHYIDADVCFFEMTV